MALELVNNLSKSIVNKYILPPTQLHPSSMDLGNEFLLFLNSLRLLNYSVTSLLVAEGHVTLNCLGKSLAPAENILVTHRALPLKNQYDPWNLAHRNTQVFFLKKGLLRSTESTALIGTWRLKDLCCDMNSNDLYAPIKLVCILIQNTLSLLHEYNQGMGQQHSHHMVWFIKTYVGKKCCKFNTRRKKQSQKRPLQLQVLSVWNFWHLCRP